MRKHIPPQSLFFLVREEIAHCPLTVPSGDTPCVTAGDARRVNPWRSGEVEREASDTGGVAQHPLLLLSQRLQCDAAGVGVLSVHTPTGSPSFCSGITRG